MNAGEEESDDGLQLAGEGTVGSAYNPMMMDPNIDMNFQKMPSVKQFNGWVQWFLSQEDHEFLLEVERDFIADKMNLIGLRDYFSTKEKYNDSLKLLMSSKIPNEEDIHNQKFLELNQDASNLYCLIHARFVLSPTGLAKIYSKYLQGVFG